MSHIIRQAERKDLPAIEQLVHSNQLNPNRLNWKRFIVATDEKDTLIGCGQIKPHFDGSYELASLVVEQNRRSLGLIKDFLIALLERSPSNSVWAIIDKNHIPLRRYGVRQVKERSQMPLYFKIFFILYPIIKSFHKNVIRNDLILICYDKRLLYKPVKLKETVPKAIEGSCQ